MQRSEHEMPGFRRFERDRHRLEVAKLTNENDIRILAQRSAQCALERRSVQSHLPLRYDAALVLVDEFDRVFDRDDVVVTRPVDEVDQGPERCGFSRAGGTGDKHQSFRQETKRLDFGRDAHRFHGCNLCRDYAEYAARSHVIAKCVGAKPREAFDLVGKVGVVDFLEFCDVSVRHDGDEHRLQSRSSHRLYVAHSLELTVNPQNRRLTHAEVKVRCRLVHQCPQQIIDFGFCRRQRRVCLHSDRGRSGSRYFRRLNWWRSVTRTRIQRRARDAP